MAPAAGLELRRATPSDALAIHAIYEHAVRYGTATFDVEAPSPAAIASRLVELVDAGFPYLVAVQDGAILGFAYAAPFRLRAAYASTLEDSVYIAPSAQGLGVGRLLLEALVRTCEAAGYRSLLALIGDSASAASIGLHAACGFTPAGTLHAVGFKHGRWLDVVLMERALGAAATTPPTL